MPFAAMRLIGLVIQTQLMTELKIEAPLFKKFYSETRTVFSNPGPRSAVTAPLPWTLALRFREGYK